MTERSRWGFEALDDAEYQEFVSGRSQAERTCPRAAPPPDSSTTGDDSPVVEVVLSEDGQVAAVRVVPNWRGRIEPPALGDEVVQAANRTAARRLSHRESETGLPAERPVDLSPWGGSLERLVAEAQRDLALYEAASLRAGRHPTILRSRTGVVTVAGRAGFVDTVEIDPHWLRRARPDEIDGELTEVLARARTEMAPASVQAGPIAPASKVLAELARRPTELLRAAGLEA